ncbi:cytochrome b5 domain-containing protein 1 [Diabrotica virgifera virgifera]|uniref:Cytochrome b5 domain-containing protein 1 n=1 Tax=Diabrotica virgifera virgifera TaxID=50390 RepID=A0A6P7FCY4_DIAVI|nr:cytochrome b5 domain-containing protein 1 [Diabrotica virgifera virgifera]
MNNDDDQLDKKWTYYAPFEVVIHNTPEDCWVSFLGKVFDVTPIVERHRNERCVLPLLAMAGKDITQWFDEATGDIQHYVHPETGCRVPYCPHGPIPDVSVQVPATDWKPLDRPPWWMDEQYQIGLLTKRVRPLRVVNMVAPFFKEVLINVCCEDNFYRIQERYNLFNSDAGSYTWRYKSKNIDMNKTMEENGILDERDTFTRLGLPQNYYVPSVFLYYNDDLKYCDFDDDECEPLPSDFGLCCMKSRF